MVGEDEHGVWKGGSSPHQPLHSSSTHGPRWGANLLRPMISAPMPGPQLLAKASSTPVVPPGSPCISRKLRVGKNHSWSLVPACPKGASRLWPSPVPKPSSETEKLWTRTRDMESLLARCADHRFARPGSGEPGH